MERQLSSIPQEDVGTVSSGDHFLKQGGYEVPIELKDTDQETRMDTEDDRHNYEDISTHLPARECSPPLYLMIQ